MSGKQFSLYDIVTNNILANPANYTLNQLNREINNYLELENKEYSVIGAINKVLKQSGQTKFVHLSPGFQESNVAIALHCGNGVVAKIIPREFSDNLPDITGSGYGRAPLLLPSILSSEVKGNYPVTGFKVKFYPYVKDNHVTRDNIELYKQQINEFGLRVIPKDDRPINFRKLPDKNKTVVGIDADMLEITDEKKFRNSTDAVNKWVDYLEKIYPVYQAKVVPVQTDNMLFQLDKDIALPSSQYLQLDLLNKKAPDLKTNVETIQAKKNIFSWFKA